MRIAFLGLGKMGTAVARLLLDRNHSLTVWNRTATAADPLRAAGADVAATPREAVKGCPAVFTMLADDGATRSVVFGDQGASGILRSMEAGAIHVSLSTIGVKLSRLLAQAHREQGQFFVAAPVFGRPIIAEQGKLWVAAAGPEHALEQVRPVLQAMSRGITVVSEEPWRAHALKLGGNFLISAMIQALSEGFVFAESQGIAPHLFLETVNAALFQSPFYAQYGKTLLDPPEHPGATVELGNKDTGLLREAAAEAGAHLPLADYIARQLQRAAEAGMLHQDWAVGQYRMAQSISVRDGKD